MPQFCRTKTVVWSGTVGYKALFIDFSQGSGLTQYEYDMMIFGPIFGVTARLANKIGRLLIARTRNDTNKVRCPGLVRREW